MKRAQFAAVLTLACWGCGQGSPDQFRSNLPTPDTVQLRFPGSSAQGIRGEVGSESQALQGSLSIFYVVTRVTTVVVNGATAAVLGLVHGIALNPPTSVNGNTVVWGPYTDPLSPNTYRLTATNNGNNHYSYSLEGKSKQAPDSAYLTLISGNHVASVDSHGRPMEGFGSGDFVIDWNHAGQLPEHDANVGIASFTYSRVSPTAQLQIGVVLNQVNDPGSNPPIRMNATYRYQDTPGADDGQFDYRQSRSNHIDASRARENLSIRSRFQAAGAGRSDVLLTGGDFTAQATINECWDTSFNSQFLRVSYDPSENYGNEATNCAFPSASYYSP